MAQSEDTQTSLISPAQCRAARAWLNWTQAELVRRSAVSLSAIKDFEGGNRRTLSSIRSQLQRTFEDAGVDAVKMTAGGDARAPRPRAIKKLTLPVAVLRAMPDDHQYALMLLGLFLNEVNWLRKLLVKSALGIDDSPNGQANFGLTVLMATTLAGKIHEGWDKITKGRLSTILAQIGMTPELAGLHKLIDDRLKGNAFLKIRNGLAFHYPDRKFEFKKLADELSDTDTVIYMVPEGYMGDVFSQISHLAGLEPLLALNEDPDYRVALKAVWDEITEITGHYCFFVSERMSGLLATKRAALRIEDMLIPDAPEADEDPLKFFVHPPSDLAEMEATVAADRSTKP
jgi:hypothetical protein